MFKKTRRVFCCAFLVLICVDSKGQENIQNQPSGTGNIKQETSPKVLPKPYQNTSQSQIAQTLKLNEPQKTFQLSMAVGGSSNLYKVESAESKQDGFIQLIPHINFKNGQSVNLRLYATQSTDAEQKTSLLDTRVTYALKPVINNKNIKLTPRVKAFLPTNKEKIDKEYYRGAIALNALSEFKVPKVSFLQLIYSVDMQKNIHKWDRNQQGDKNISHYTGQSLSVLLKLSKKIQITSTGSYKLNWDYKLMQLEKFLFEHELNYQLNKNISLVGGVSNGGLFWKNGGAESNVAVFDGNTSELFAYVTYKF